MATSRNGMGDIHLIGLGGVGMNGLAQLAVRAGCSVTGSDRAYSPDSILFRCLHNMGVAIVPQDGSGITPNTEKVVFSTAIEKGNPDLDKAIDLGIPTVHRASFLRELVGNASTFIAVAGTAGKTTTTGMLGWIFEELGFNPSVYNGAAVLNWKTPDRPGNVRYGSPDFWIIEADESDKSFLNFHPTHSIITNISKDHFEIDELNVLFSQFRQQTSGIIIEGEPHSSDIDGATELVFGGMAFPVPLLGRHNRENALCAIRLCSAMGLDMVRVRDALARFKGIERRLEVVGSINGVTVIDDYAHNASKISAAINAVGAHFPHLVTYWRPHGFTPLFQGMDDLVSAFAKQWSLFHNPLFILPVFYAGGTVDRKATSEDLVANLNSAGVPARFIPDYISLKREVEQYSYPGGAILGMGARDPELPWFARKLVENGRDPAN